MTAGVLLAFVFVAQTVSLSWHLHPSFHNPFVSSIVLIVDSLTGNIGSIFSHDIVSSIVNVGRGGISTFMLSSLKFELYTEA